jgi:phage gp36-like protein
MDYVTPLQLAESPGAVELAQCASASTGAIVDAELMDLTLRGGDRSAYSSDDIAAADDAAARIHDAIVDAGAIIDGYIGKRYALPLASPPPIVSAWARAIVRCKLNKDRAGDPKSDPVARDYADALAFLKLIAAGNFSLGPDDPTIAPPAPGDTQFNTGTKVFGRDASGLDNCDPTYRRGF